MLFIYFLFMFHAVLGFEYPRKEKTFYDIDDAESHFNSFINTHNKTYATEMEKAKRFEIFKRNIFAINEQNEKDPYGVFGINRFTDLTLEEFSRKHTGLSSDLGDGADVCNVITDMSTKEAPDAFDWRDHISMLVKDQHLCSSCWAFAATANVEAQYSIRYKRYLQFSEQQLIDCDTKSHGCCKGVPAYALRYLIQSGGQAPEEVYPYVHCQQICQFSPGQAQVRVTDCNIFDFPNEDLIKEALYKFGPLTAGIDSTSLVSYDGGVAKTCSFKEYDHAVLIVGYGRDNVDGRDFWVIKNSWGTRWGENGFGRIERGVNACGIRSSFIASAIIQ